MHSASPSKDGATAPRDTPRPHQLHGGNLIHGSKGPVHGVGLGASHHPAPLLLKANTKAGLPQPWLMLDLSVVLAARLSQFQQPVATATEL